LGQAATLHGGSISTFTVYSGPHKLIIVQKGSLIAVSDIITDSNRAAISIAIVMGEITGSHVTIEYAISRGFIKTCIDNGSHYQVFL
jgi:hypothetical protein